MLIRDGILEDRFSRTAAYMVVLETQIVFRVTLKFYQRCLSMEKKISTLFESEDGLENNVERLISLCCNGSLETKQ